MKTSEKIQLVVYGGVFVLVLGYNLVDCNAKVKSNRDNFDTEKYFNAVMDEDDKVQLSIEDGPVILRDMSKIKLLNSENAGKNSIYNYALTLAGSEDRVFNHSDKVKVYTKK